MAAVFKYWDGNRWNECSADEAKTREKAGQRILKRGDAPKPAVSAPKATGTTPPPAGTPAPTDKK